MLAQSCHAGTSSGAVVCETGAEVSLVLGATIASHRAAEDHSLSSTHRVMVRLGLYQNLELTDLRGFGENSFDQGDEAAEPRAVENQHHPYVQ